MCFPLIDLRERGNGKEGASHILNTFSGRDPYQGSGIDLPEGMWASAGGRRRRRSVVCTGGGVQDGHDGA